MSSGNFKKGHVPWNKGAVGLQQHPNKGKVLGAQPTWLIEKRLDAQKKVGYKHSAQTRELISIVKTGKKRGSFSDEWREKLGKVSRGKKRSLEFRLKISGEKSHLWRGGITPKNTLIRQSVEYKTWRKSVFERDGYKCVWGGQEHGNKIQADHIKPFAYYPEIRFDINNGRTLCVSCHKKTDTFLKRKSN